MTQEWRAILLVKVEKPVFRRMLVERSAEILVVHDAVIFIRHDGPGDRQVFRGRDRHERFRRVVKSPSVAHVNVFAPAIPAFQSDVCAS